MTKDEIRKQFPALERGVAYFDAPGGTQVPRAVGEAMLDYLYRHNANTHWAYPTSAETDAIIANARLAVADFLNCSDREVVFGANMSTLTFHVSRALARTWSRGDEVIVTQLDHHANVAPWRELERDFGVVTRMARMNRDTVSLDVEHLAGLVSDKTKLIAVGGASNAVGTINDLERLAALARDAGALFFVDAVHLAPHELIDVQQINCDFLGCSSYKFYGPHAGVFFMRESLIDSLPFPKLDPAPNEAPDRAETGTQNHEAIAGIGATIDFIASLGGAEGTRRERLTRTFDTLHDEGSRFVEILLDGLSSIKRVRLYSAPKGARRTPTIAFTVDGMTAEEVAREMVKDDLYLSHGDFYAATVIEVLGVEALVRAGCACYTTEEEVRRLVASVERIAR